MFLSDTGHNRLLRVSPTGKFLDRWGGTTEPGQFDTPPELTGGLGKVDASPAWTTSTYVDSADCACRQPVTTLGLHLGGYHHGVDERFAIGLADLVLELWERRQVSQVP